MNITFSQALTGYQLHIEARRLSPHTVADYQIAFRKFRAHLDGDLPLEQITCEHVRSFLASLPELSAKTCLNHHIALSALWTWAANENLVERNIVRLVDPPKPDEIAIAPFSKSDLEALLSHLKKGREYTRFGQHLTSNAIPTADRNRALILLLLDTGLRVGELSALRILDCDLKNTQVFVHSDGRSNRTKNRRERILPISPKTAQALWRYLSSRSSTNVNMPLLATRAGAVLNRHEISHILDRVGRRAGVTHVNPHRFRHTFAIEFLRNGGNVYALRDMLGHSSLDMCLRYLSIIQSDLAQTHQMASPVMHWNL